MCRATLKDDLLKPTQPPCSMSNSATLLLDTVLILTGLETPWSGFVLKYLAQNRLFYLLRGIFLTVVCGWITRLMVLFSSAYHSIVLYLLSM